MNLRAILEWEELLFRAARGLVRTVRGRDPGGASPQGVCLQSCEHRLALLAQLAAGQRLLVKPAERLGGVRGAVVLLPTRMELAPSIEENLELYGLRALLSGTMVSGAMVRGTFVGAAAIREARQCDAAKFAAWLLGAQRAVNALGESLGAFESRWSPAAAYELAKRRSGPPISLGDRGDLLEVAIQAVLRGEPLPEDLTARVLALPEGGGLPEGAWLLGGPLGASELAKAEKWGKDAGLEPAFTDAVTALDAPPRDDVQRALLDPDADPDPRPIHSFEKAEALDAWNGGMRQLDGEDELLDHQEALQDVDLRHVIRGGPPVGSLLRADIELSGEIPDLDTQAQRHGGIAYPEWDWRAKRLKSGWVTVYPEVCRAVEPDYGRNVAAEYAPTIRRLRAILWDQRLADERRRGERDGSDVDLVAAVDDWADRAAAGPGTDRLYEDVRRQRRDSATLVVMDLSLSADAWVENRRVLDVTREAVVVMGEVAHELGDCLAVSGFASHTRHRCGWYEVKAFDTPWPAARARLGPLTPRGYTRIGPALRHGAALLGQRPERHRLLILLTDGKPTDFDRYEGKHGLDDVAHAVRQAQAMGVAIHALGLDPGARRALAAMFGPGRYTLLRHLNTLPSALTAAWAQLV